MSQHMPNGAGICYQMNKAGLFEFQPMISHCNWSYESIRWLTYMETVEPFFSKVKIQHALNGGEKEVKINGRSYFVDGFAELNGTKYFLEFDGCRFHKHNCINSLRSKLPQKDDTQRNRDLSLIGVLLQTFECDWLKIKAKPKINISRFFARKDIRANELMGAVADGSFYGIIRCDIFSPPDVVNYFLKLNHPPIFTHKCLEEDMVGAPMKKLLEERSAKFPLEKQLTLVFHHKQYVLNTDLAKFYIAKGMQLTNLTLAIEYTKSKPLADFVHTVTENRKEATRKGDQNLQNTWKLIMNSCYGRSSLNLTKRRKYKYLAPKDAPTLDDNIFVTNVAPVHGEFESGFVEVSEKKRKTTDKVPGKISPNFTIYSILKITDNNFYQFCLIKCQVIFLIIIIK